MKTFMPAAEPRGQAELACPKRVARLVPVDRWELLSLVIDLRRELGLTDRDISVLRAHLTVLPRGDLAPGRVNTSFMEVAEILQRACGMEERRFRRGETRLAEAGLVRRRLSANGRRFPERDANGVIVAAYGIDLNPLLERIGELTELLKLRREEELRIRRMKNAISARLQDIVREHASPLCALPAWLETLRTRVRSMIRRKTVEIPELQALEDELTLVEPQVDSAPEQSELRAPRAEPARPDASHADVPPGTLAADDGQTVRRIESPLKENNKSRCHHWASDAVEHSWQATEMIREFYPEQPQREHDLASVLIEFSCFLGLGQPVFERGLSCLGWAGMITALDYLAKKAGTLAKPSGYFTAMIAAFNRGEPIAGGRIRPSDARRCSW